MISILNAVSILTDSAPLIFIMQTLGSKVWVTQHLKQLPDGLATPTIPEDSAEDTFEFP